MAVPPSRATLREELSRCSGWKPGLGESTELRQGEREYQLNFLGTVGTRRVFLIEAAERGALPSQRERLGLLRRLCGGEGAIALLFVDAAATTRVWGWRREPGGLWAAEPWRVDPRGIPLLPFSDRGSGGMGRSTPPMRAGEEAAIAVLWRRRRRIPGGSALFPDGGPPRGAAELSSAIQACDDLRTILRLHAELLRCRLLEPAVEDGDWLTGALEGLGLVSEACLERMQGWIVDAPAGKRYGETLRRIRRLLLRRGELADESGVRERLALEGVLLHCLRGVAARPEEAARVRSRIAQRLGLPLGDSAEAAALVDVRIGTLEGDGWKRSDLPRGCASEGVLQRTHDGLLTEIAALARAEELLARMRLEHGITLRALAEGQRAIRRRRRNLYDVLARCGSSVAAGGRLHPWLEFSAVLENGRFDLVRHPTGREERE